MADERKKKFPDATGCAEVKLDGQTDELQDGAVLIAAITSCTNTSNPYVMMAAGLLARNAAKYGLKAKPWVKTSLAPGSRVVTDYLHEGRLCWTPSQSIGFNLVGYGCTTCIGNSGPLKPEISAGMKAGDIVATSVLSGNRNFEGRVHPEVKMNFLASPPLVVAYALAGTLDFDLHKRSRSARDPTASPSCSPTSGRRTAKSRKRCTPRSTSDMFRKSYASVFTGDANWQAIKIPLGKIYAWEEESTYVKNPPYFDGMTMTPRPVGDVTGARVPRAARRFRHHGPHLPRRQHLEDEPRREVSRVDRACSRSTSTPTARAAATTK